MLNRQGAKRPLPYARDWKVMTTHRQAARCAVLCHYRGNFTGKIAASLDDEERDARRWSALDQGSLVRRLRHPPDTHPYGADWPEWLWYLARSWACSGYRWVHSTP